MQVQRPACFLFALVLALVSAPNAVDASSSATTSPAVESAVSVPSGQIDRAVRRLDALTRALMRRTGVPGLAVAVVHDDKVVYLKGYGVRKVGTNQRVDADTVFMLASVSKPLGASVVAIAGRAVSGS